MSALQNAKIQKAEHLKHVQSVASPENVQIRLDASAVHLNVTRHMTATASVEGLQLLIVVEFVEVTGIVDVGIWTAAGVAAAKKSLILVEYVVEMVIRVATPLQFTNLRVSMFSSVNYGQKQHQNALSYAKV